jgi:hypothetical protein
VLCGVVLVFIRFPGIFVWWFFLFLRVSQGQFAHEGKRFGNAQRSLAGSAPKFRSLARAPRQQPMAAVFPKIGDRLREGTGRQKAESSHGLSAV